MLAYLDLALKVSFSPISKKATHEKDTLPITEPLPKFSLTLRLLHPADHS